MCLPEEYVVDPEDAALLKEMGLDRETIFQEAPQFRSINFNAVAEDPTGTAMLVTSATTCAPESPGLGQS